MTTGLNRFRAARDFLIDHRSDHDTACAQFRWPELDEFNWALDHFDELARDNHHPALWLLGEDGSEDKLSFAELSERSNQVANHLESLGVMRGDRVLLMLGNEVALWELMLGCIKIGAVMIPATNLLTHDDLVDRLERGNVRHIVTNAANAAKFDGLSRQLTRLLAGPPTPGWIDLSTSRRESTTYVPRQPTRASEPLLLYFTSGTTSKPKLVQHTHASYPVGHLSTMYWIGLQANDVHWNISSPGWAKHAWSCFFAPWIAGACIFIYNQPRFDARRVLEVLVQRNVTTLCAPPTVWRMLIQEPLADYPVKLRELVSAGEPLNPEVIEQVRKAWGITIRDGYGQTETCALVGNPPGQTLKLGSMGRPLPGFRVVLLDADEQPASEGEIALELEPRPIGLMPGYADDSGKTSEVMRGGHYHTGDVGARDADGYITYVGRADDVFKSSDYRISPFELESVLIEHPAVAEAAIVPSPDPIRHTVPKAFVTLVAGHAADAATAQSILQFCRERLAPYKRVRRLEFGELPKTISGKIRRVEMRVAEAARAMPVVKGTKEYFDDELKGG